ncbi:nitroreductase family protein [Paenibacillus sp. P96]|uniref:Nitroreductase family protein n=1 Tax=Paenibacillus zeirhizosphaerae TaxID=2987519 RepID=A0ABT9FPP8_9BACL|nr:nitroreductase family protein [Paenibacillus sp. P96]MDP4096697.1 nitroreductase family protein [Paenibacillus sp. P96]
MDSNQTKERKDTFKQIIEERRSIRNYDVNAKISREEIEEMLELATKAPSSTNLQPWRFIVIESPEAKEKLLPLAAFNSKQVTTSAAVIAVFGDLDHVEYLNEIYSKAVEIGVMPQEVKDRMVEQISAGYATLTREQKKEVVLIDSGLVSMNLMLVAKAYGYDTNPIGGYDRENLGEVFGLEKERYEPIMLISIGKAIEEGYPSYRLPVSTVAKFH